ncbi:PadR family transcriptional regulator [Paenibacillus sp. N4]|uniref:PadR family transcriptional regulator n=1 Tax=Paenibacillus vietnamensis TaxID=2590547 RepID=UPI001CD13C5C|nr:PadR family transcriptional regulator [Paenibacillus vietnamensis]MCA0753577.1 PadR family transcriptional regulator [Paenibacillus vietnamensis]
MAIKLLILGLLMERDRHPYEIRQTMKERNWHVAFKVRDGSLYYAVDQLRQDGLIEAAEIIPSQGDNRPDKRIYRITEKGNEAFLDLLYAQFGQTAVPFHPLFPGLPFVRRGEMEKVAELMEKQLADCEARIAKLSAVLEMKHAYLPRGAIHMIQGIIRFSETELDWLNDMLDDVRSGKMAEPGYDPRGAEGCSGAADTNEVE